MRRARNDRGSLSIYVAFLAPAVLALAGLVIDGGGALVAKQRAADEAEQAARAGANEIDIAALRDSGARTIDCSAAETAVNGYFSAGGDPHAFLPCTLNTVTVSVTVKYQSILLGKTFQMTQVASASPVCDNNQLCSALADSPATAPGPLVRHR